MNAEFEVNGIEFVNVSKRWHHVESLKGKFGMQQ
jgi:hypothetical protein